MNEWSVWFMGLAEYYASKSKDPSTKVGCVIAKDKHQISQGFNGFPSGIQDSTIRLMDRETRLKLTIHAEVNALHFADRRDLEDSTLYCTLPPCVRCATQIIQCKVAKVICYPATGKQLENWGSEIELSKQLFQEAEVIYMECARD